MEMEEVPRDALSRRQVFNQDASKDEEIRLRNLRETLAKINSARDYYGRLGVSRTAVRDEIRTQYRKRAKIIYPDIVPPQFHKEAENAFKLLSEAHETLADESRRRLYDLGLQEMSIPSRSSSSSSASYQPRASRDDISVLLKDVADALDQADDLRQPLQGNVYVIGDRGLYERQAIQGYSRAVQAFARVSPSERSRYREELRRHAWRIEQLLEPRVKGGRSISNLKLLHEIISLSGRNPRKELDKTYRAYVRELLSWHRGTGGIEDATKVAALWGVDISSQIARVMARPRKGWFAERIDRIREAWFFFTH